MGLRFRKRILQFTIAISLGTGISAAQQPVEDALPEAPVPAGTEIAASSSQKKETRPASLQNQVGMTAKQKYGLTYRRIVSLQTPLKALFVSGWEVGTGTGPDIATNGWKPFGKRVGYNAAGIATSIFFTTGFVPALAHQDPRYFPLGKGLVKERLVWAVRSEFVGVGDDGHKMPNYANLVGLALSSVAVDAFTPRESAGFDDTVERYAIDVGLGAGLNVIREFNVFERVKAIAHHSKSAEK
jgi:hypothetical protein